MSAPKSTKHRARESKLLTAAVLGLSCAVGAMLVIPYLAAMMPEVREAPLPLWALALASGAQTGVLATILGFLGLKAGEDLDLGAPILHAAVNRAPMPRVDGAKLAGAAALGAVVALAVAGADVWLFLPQLELVGAAPPTPSPIAGLAASVYGGVTEEVLLRLFAVTSLAWVLRRLGLSKKAAVTAAVLSAALLFGVLHLPAAGAIFQMDTWLVARTLTLNGLLGIIFGTIYVRDGLEHAITAHFAADLVLHVFLPLAT